MGLHVIEHPLLQDALAVLRDRSTGTAAFRAALARAGALLFQEASAGLPTEAGSVETPLGRAEVRRLRPGVLTLVPVLRAGLGMLEGVLPMVPGARVAHVGVRRDEETAEPSEYYRNLPASAAGTVAFVLDPMLATGGTLLETVGILDAAGMAEIRVLSVVAAPEGVRALRGAFPEVEVFLAALDGGLDARKYILPGLGDAGDRCFGTEP
ncbi:MAG: uracil phosphoribosyltransferase [Planctomycetes bacterium]|nr:uracil phosphoribosyltransferase [Planctomycetota bacterium]